MRNTNQKYVVVKEDRKCKVCSGKIPKGTKCLTLNKRYQGRVWVCQDCIASMKRVQLEKYLSSIVPFDDEGWSMAQQEALDEALGDYYERSGIWLG